MVGESPPGRARRRSGPLRRQPSVAAVRPPTRVYGADEKDDQGEPVSVITVLVIGPHL
ncbi:MULTISPECIES: hypothetical protein [Streptomycetaceae]|uniref:hypothetical protein n=1 Tax=Streptomycetaceae TaxID=2062 RepID=UPI001301599F|nr:hypothetical protein [Streptomyces sp. CB02056]